MLENLTLTQTDSTLQIEADDPWRDWSLLSQKMGEASYRMLSIQIQEEEDKRVLQVIKNGTISKSTLSNDIIFLSGIQVMNVQKPIHFGGYI